MSSQQGGSPSFVVWDNVPAKVSIAYRGGLLKEVQSRWNRLLYHHAYSWTCLEGPKGIATIRRSPFSVPWQQKGQLLNRIGPQPLPSSLYLSLSISHSFCLTRFVRVSDYTGCTPCCVSARGSFRKSQLRSNHVSQIRNQTEKSWTIKLDDMLTNLSISIFTGVFYRRYAMLTLLLWNTRPWYIYI